MTKKPPKLARYSIELIVIFAGITTSLLVDEWRDHRKERELESKYLESLQNALVLDGQNLSNLIAKQQLKKQNIVNLLTFLRDGLPYREDVFRNGVMAVATFSEFIPQDATFQDLKSTGNILVISDYNLREALFAYYHFCYQLQENDQSIDESINCAISAPVLEALPLLNVFPLIPGAGNLPVDSEPLAANTGFMNAVAARIMQTNSQQGFYQKAAQLNKALLERLNAARKK